MEESIKVLKELCQRYYNNEEIKIEGLNRARYIVSLKNLLLDYEKVQQENKDLKDENNFLKKSIQIYMD